jgi:hypothetical protein
MMPCFKVVVGQQSDLAWNCRSGGAGNGHTSRRPACDAGLSECWLQVGWTITQEVDHHAQQEKNHIYPAEIPLWRMPKCRACCQLEADLASSGVGNSVVFAVGPGLPVVSRRNNKRPKNRPAVVTGG